MTFVFRLFCGCLSSEAVRRRREEGVPIDALAREFRISRRSVFRILARRRGEKVPAV